MIKVSSGMCGIFAFLSFKPAYFVLRVCVEHERRSSVPEWSSGFVKGLLSYDYEKTTLPKSRCIFTPSRVHIMLGTPFRFDISQIDKSSFQRWLRSPDFTLPVVFTGVSNFKYRQCRWIQMLNSSGDGSGVPLTTEKTDSVLEILDVARCW